MLILPVLDIRAGTAVHAVGGRREHYRPLVSALHEGSDPIELVRAFRSRFGFEQIYVADLDAIGGGPPDATLLSSLAAEGFRVWCDPGVRDRPPALPDRVDLVVGTETLAGAEALGRLIETPGPDRLVLSLDLHGGELLCPRDAEWPERTPMGVVGTAAAAGVRRIILLDLTRVGMCGGVSGLGLLEEIRVVCPSIAAGVGGGVRGREDLGELERRGSAFALVGTALHTGAVSADEIRERGWNNPAGPID